MKARPVRIVLVEAEARVSRIVIAGINRAVRRVDPRLVGVTITKSTYYVIRRTRSQINLVSGKAIPNLPGTHQRLIGRRKLGVGVRFFFDPVLDRRTAGEKQENQGKSPPPVHYEKSIENLYPFKENPDGRNGLMLALSYQVVLH
jgi:hypothetical protein